jgi:hypothetical protein
VYWLFEDAISLSGVVFDIWIMAAQSTVSVQIVGFITKFVQQIHLLIDNQEEDE